MRPVDRVRLVIIMTIAGLNGIMSSVKLIGDLIRSDSFHDELLIMLIHVGVIFWLAAEAYGLRLTQDQEAVKKQRLMDAVRAYEHRLKDGQQ